jgi:hypothetical protein
MSDLFSHKEQDADVVVTEKKTPSGIVFLEPAGSAGQGEPPEPDSPQRPDRPSSS